jgi:hypothetical protein
MSDNKLSADPIALILGIISLVIVFFGCCCGYLAAIALVMAIIGLVLATSSLKEYDSNYENYSFQSRKNVYSAKIICIIGIVLSSIFLILSMDFFSFYNKNEPNVFFKKYFENKEIRHNKKDSTSKKSNEVINATDSVYTDSIKVEEIKK